jgi:translocation and assembly module TamB
VSVARKIFGVIMVTLLIPLLGALWILATESGTGWLIGKLEDRLPQELSIGRVSGSFLDGLTADSLAWRGSDLQLEVGETALDIQLLPLARRQLVVDTLDINALRIRLSEDRAKTEDSPTAPTRLPIAISLRAAEIRSIDFERGDVRRFGERLAIAGEFDDQTIQVSRLEFRSPWLDVDLSGSGMLDNRLPLDVRAKWRWKDEATTGISGRLEAKGDLDQYRIHHELDEPQRITTAGTVSYAREALDVDLLNDWMALQIPIGDRMLSSSQGKLRLSGGVDDFLIELDAGIRVDEHAESAVRLSGNGRWTPTPRFDLRYEVSELDPTLATDYLTGSAASQGTLALSFANGAPDLTLAVERLEGDLNGYVIDGRAIVHYADGRTTVRDAVVALGDNTVSGGGQFGDTLRIDADVDFADLAQIVADASGSIRGRVAVGGDLARPEADIGLQGTNIAWGEIAVGSFGADARIEGDQLGRAELTIERAAIDSIVIDTAHIALAGRPEDHAIQTSVQAFGNQLDIKANGRYEQAAWLLDLNQVRLANDPLGTWSLTASSQLQLRAGGIRLQRTCLEAAAGAGTACAEADVEAGNMTAELSVEALPLAALPITLPSGISLAGSVEAGLRAQKSGPELTIDSDLELQDAKVEALYDGERITLKFAEAAASASFVDGLLQSSARLELDKGAGSATARLAVRDGGDGDYPIDGEGEVMISDASVFAVFLSSINNPRGRIEGELTVAGTATAPEFVGEIGIVDGAFGVRQTGIEVSDVDVRIAQSQPGQMQLRGSARSGEGLLEIEGVTRVSQTLGVRSEIRLRGENFELARLPNWQIAASPSITAIFDNHVTTVVGQLAIPSARVTVREIPETAQKASRDAVVHRQDGRETDRMRRIDLHLRTSLGDDVQFSGFGLTTGLEGAIQLRGGTHSPFTGQGRLSLVDGRYKAYGQELEIEQGNLVFSGPLDEPLLDIRAIRRTPDVIAGIQISGTPSRLQSEVFSDPALGDAETLSYLLTGRPLATSMDTGEGDALNRAAFALGLSGAGLITSQIRTQLGLETLTIEGGTEESRLVAGKRLGDRLLVEYGYGLVDKLGTLMLRYQLNERFMLESRSGTVSNLDLLYRARKR